MKPVMKCIIDGGGDVQEYSGVIEQHNFKFHKQW